MTEKIIACLNDITGADEGYVLKFKTLEWLEKLKALFD